MAQLVRELGGTDALEKSENYVNYTWSKYANVRDGFKADLET